MNMLQPHPKITPLHLQRKAIVYLRQSSDRQVQRNTESQRLQYDLAARAQALGFEQVDIIDTDLGHSEQPLRNTRRNGLPVKLIDGAFLMRHEHLAGTLVELMQIGKPSSGPGGTLHHP